MPGSPYPARVGRSGRSRLDRLRSLELRDWQNLVQALPPVLLLRLALWVFTSTRVHGFLVRRPGGRGSVTATQVERLSWAVGTAARVVPYATCLTQALALQALLRRRGESSSVVIGFLRDPGGDVKGHAWLLWHGRLVIGGSSEGEFTRLLELKG